MIRVILPYHLRNLAKVDREVLLKVPDPATIGALLDELEKAFPMLLGIIREHGNKERRAYLRYFACRQDLSHDPQDSPLPDEVIRGEEPFRIVGAMSGG